MGVDTSPGVGCSTGDRWQSNGSGRIRGDGNLHPRCWKPNTRRGWRLGCRWAALESGCWQSAGYVDNGASCHYVRRILKPHRVVLLCLLSQWWQATLCIRSATGPRLLSAHLIIRKSSARCRYTPLPPPLSLFPLSPLYIHLPPSISPSPSSFMPEFPPSPPDAPRFLSRNSVFGPRARFLDV